MINARHVDDIVKEVCLELGRATAKYGPFHSAHEGHSIILEELDGLWDDIKLNAPLANQRKEAIQVAAMAIRYILDVTGSVAQTDSPGPEYHEMMDDLQREHGLSVGGAK